MFLLVLSMLSSMPAANADGGPQPAEKKPVPPVTKSSPNPWLFIPGLDDVNAPAETGAAGKKPLDEVVKDLSARVMALEARLNATQKKLTPNLPTAPAVEESPSPWLEGPWVPGWVPGPAASLKQNLTLVKALVGKRDLPPALAKKLAELEALTLKKLTPTEAATALNNFHTLAESLVAHFAK